MRRKKKVLRKALAAVMLLSLVATTNGTAVEAAAKKKPKLSNSKITLEAGQKKTIKLKNYTKLSKKKIKKVKWTTSNKKVATVKASGKYKQNVEITAQASGSATVKLKFDGKTYKCKVTVPAVSGTSTEKNTPATIATEKVVPSTPSTEKITTEKLTTEKSTTEKLVTEEPTIEKSTTEKPVTETPTTEKITTEKPVTEETTTEKSTTEKPTTEKPATEVPTTEKLTTEKTTTEVPTTEESTTETPATEHVHVYGDWTVTKEATCIAEGKEERKCSCGAVEEEDIPSVEHNYSLSDWDSGDCMHKKSWTYVCKMCGDINIEEGEYGEHQFKNGVCTVCGIEENTLVGIYTWNADASNKGHIIVTATDTGDCFSDGTRIYDLTITSDGKDELSSYYGSSSDANSCLLNNAPECIRSSQIRSVTFLNKVKAGKNSCLHLFYKFKLLSEIKGIENLDTSQSKTMEGMFQDTYYLETLDLSSADTGNVENTCCMFYGSGIKTLDLSGIDLSKDTTTRSMFEYAGNLEVIYVSEDWQIPDNCTTENMFKDCGCSQVTLK